MTDQEYSVSSSGIDVAALNLEIYRLEERRDWIQKELHRINQDNSECETIKNKVFGKEQELDDFVTKTISSIREEQLRHPEIKYIKRIERDVVETLEGSAVCKLRQSLQNIQSTIREVVGKNEDNIESLTNELREMDEKLQELYAERSLI